MASYSPGTGVDRWLLAAMWGLGTERVNAPNHGAISPVAAFPIFTDTSSSLFFVSVSVGYIVFIDMFTSNHPHIPHISPTCSSSDAHDAFLCFSPSCSPKSTGQVVFLVILMILFGVMVTL